VKHETMSCAPPVVTLLLLLLAGGATAQSCFYRSNAGHMSTDFDVSVFVRAIDVACEHDWLPVKPREEKKKKKKKKSQKEAKTFFFFSFFKK
jgi:hypothetical protein